jgi:MYXO-CTERM domain-containing protein
MLARYCGFAALAATAGALSACGAPPGESLGEGNDALRMCAKGTTVEGIDVSTYQGNINWTQVTTSNVRFAVTRISDGPSYQDSQFNRNWAAIKDVGLLRGAYQFFEPGLDALAQADMVVAKVGKLGPGDLPVQLDMEVTGGQPSATIVSRMKTWIERVTAGTGKRPIIYSAKYFWNDNIASRDFNTYPLWVANYGVTCPDMPDPWSNWTIWQYSDARTVPGIGGGVDADKFNGTLDDLKALAGMTPPQEADAMSANDGAKGDAGPSESGTAEATGEGGPSVEQPSDDAEAPVVVPDARPVMHANEADATALVAPPAAGEDSGCACTTTSPPRGAPPWILIGALPWFRRRRRVA